MSATAVRPDPTSFRGLRVGVVGLGVEGRDIVRFLHHEGATAIIVSDRQPREALADSLAALADIPFTLEAGANDVSLAERVHVLFASQGIPRDLPLLQAAEARGVPITTMMREFLRRCPAPVIGITGSAGKTTTTALVGDLFRAANRPVLVGGNIGAGPGPLDALPGLTPRTAVVLEFSHTQLARTDRSPRLAAVLNITPNHLDQFDWDAYIDLKRNIVRYQTPNDWVVLPTDNAEAQSLLTDTPARAAYFGLEALPGPGATVRDGQIVWDPSGSGTSTPVAPVSAVRLPGQHNLRNVLAAVAIAATWGLPLDNLHIAIASFRGVPHRLEPVAEVDGVRYVDDSIATTPERTVAALRTIPGPIVLLLGGREKRLPLEPLAAAARDCVRAVIGFGEAGPVFTDGLRANWGNDPAAPAIHVTADLAAAVAQAAAIAHRGDAVLLSPAGTSFDAYTHFADRGDRFAALVHAHARRTETPRGPEEGDVHGAH